ncbi:hypothetical protein BH10BDE1_BH10BDE1_08290 [soil metagenome]
MTVRAFNSSKFQILFAVVLVLLFSGVSCVSVSLGGSKTEKAKGVAFATPNGNFKEIKNDGADFAWNSGSTGSTIAYQSTCGDTPDARLESIAQDLFGGFEQSKELRDERIPFDGREALSRDVEGKVDGVVTRVRAIIYKKNKCTYILTFVALDKTQVADSGRKAAINGDVAEFEKFAASFKAP